MRTIKFRAWDKKEKKLHYDIGISNTGAVMLWIDASGGATFLGDTGKGLPEIMQYTGLKDKNGKEIYEGDLLKVGEQIYQIAWYGLSAAFWLFTTAPISKGYYTASAGVPARDWNFLDAGEKVNWHNGPTEELEVIGNIYENKELLK